MTQENKSETQSSKSPREIEAAIDETRNSLSGDIKALSDKASISNIKQEAKQAAKQAKDNLVEKAVDKSVEVKDVVVDKALEIKDIAVEKATEAKDIAISKAQEAGDAVSEAYDEVAYTAQRAGRVAWRFTVANAVPLGLIGIGAGWLISNQRSQTARLAEPDVSWDDDDALDYPDDYGYPADNLAFAGTNELSRGRVSSSAARPARRGPSALNKAGKRLRQGTKNVYAKAGQELEQAQHTLADTAAHSRDIVQDRLQRVQTASRDFAAANPLALAFGTLIAGLGVGLLLPSSSREDTLLQPARARIRSVVGTARDVAEDVRNVAKQTAHDSLSRAARDIDAPH
jgi:hypothetical protein